MATPGFSVSELISLISVACKIYEGIRSSTITEQSLFSETLALHGVLLALQKYPQPATGPAIPHDIVESCARTLQDIVEIYQKISTSSRIRGALLRLQARDRMGILKNDLDRHKATFSLLLSVASTFNSASANEEIKGLQIRIDEIHKMNLTQIVAYEERFQAINEIERRHRILDWISAYDYSSRHSRLASARVPGSCEWFQNKEAFQRWYKGHYRVLTVYGKAGSGKSTICSMVVDTITNKLTSLEAVAYFYIDYSDGISYSKLLASLLRQCLERCPNIPNDVTLSFNQRGTGTLDSSTLERMFLNTLSTFSQTYICIDAIDELESISIELLSSLWSKIVPLQDSIRVISFSRQLIVPIKINSLHYVESFYIDKYQDNERDLEIFINNILDEKLFLVTHKELKQELSRGLLARANGMFLWVKLALNDILQEKSPKAMIQALDRYPEGLHNTYERIWRTDCDQRTEDAIVFMLLASSPLAVNDLETVVNEARKDDESFASEHWLVHSRGFIEVSEQERVHFIHYSAIQFLKQKGILETQNSLKLRAILHKFQQSGYEDKTSSILSIHGQIAISHVLDESETREDDTDSVMSWTDSVFTGKASVSSYTTQSSQFSRLESISKQYATLFMNQPRLKSVILEFLNIKGREGFIRYFPQLLTAYSAKLQVIALTPSQKVAALMAGHNTTITTDLVVLCSGFLDSSKIFSEQATVEELTGSRENLDKYLERHDRGTIRVGSSQLSDGSSGMVDGKTIESATQNNEIITETVDFVKHADPKILAYNTFSSRHSVDDDIEEIYVNLQKIKEFLVNTQPFYEIEKAMQKALCVQPVLPTVEAIVEAQPKVVRTEIWYIRFAQKIAHMLLKILPGGEERLEPGMKRVRWTCLSGRQHYDDFYEVRPGAVKDLQRELDSAFPSKIKKKQFKWLKTSLLITLGASVIVLKRDDWMLVFLIGAVSIIFSSSLFILLIAGIILHPRRNYINGIKIVPNTSKNLRTLTGWRDSAHSSSRENVATGRGSSSTSRAVITGSVDITDQDTWLDDDSDGSNTPENVTADETSNYTADQQLWILPLFLNNREKVKVVHINAKRRNTDFSLFRGLREKYFIVSSAWTRFVKLHQVSAIRIVRFNLTGKRRGDILQKNTWPPDHTPRVWFYEPFPANAETVPLISSKYLMWIWQDALNADMAAYEELWQRGSWHLRFIQWLRDAPHVICQDIRQALSRIEDFDDEITELNVLPAQVHHIDAEQPDRQVRSKYAIRRLPKKHGGKLICDFRSNQYPEGWGIEFEETFHIHRLLFFFLINFSVGSLSTLLYLWHRYGFVSPEDITLSAWLSIIGWATSFASLSCTVWFKWAEVRTSQ